MTVRTVDNAMGCMTKADAIIARKIRRGLMKASQLPVPGCLAITDRAVHGISRDEGLREEGEDEYMQIDVGKQNKDGSYYVMWFGDDQLYDYGYRSLPHQ